MDVSGRMGIKKRSESGIETGRKGPNFRAGVVGSNPAGPTTRRTGPARARIFATLWELRKRGFSDITLKVKGERLRFLAKHVNLDDPEDVKGFIANQANWSNAYKQGVAYAYNSYAEVNGLSWSLHACMHFFCILIGSLFV